MWCWTICTELNGSLFAAKPPSSMKCRVRKPLLRIPYSWSGLRPGWGYAPQNQGKANRRTAEPKNIECRRKEFCRFYKKDRAQRYHPSTFCGSTFYGSSVRFFPRFFGSLLISFLRHSIFDILRFCGSLFCIFLPSTFDIPNSEFINPQLLSFRIPNSEFMTPVLWNFSWPEQPTAEPGKNEPQNRRIMNRRMSKGGFAALSLFINRPFDTVVRSWGSRREALDRQNTLFDVGRWTCPQCLDSGVSSIQQCDLYTAVSTNQMHYAWQAGVRCSMFIF